MTFPNHISDLYVRLTADSLGLSDSDPVTTWTNQAGSYLNFDQSDPGQQPSYKASGANGLPAVTFDKTSDQWLGTSDITSIASNPYTVVVVWKPLAEGRQDFLRLGDPTTSDFDLDFSIEYRGDSALSVVTHNAPDPRAFAYSSEFIPQFQNDVQMWSYTQSGNTESDLSIFHNNISLGTKAGTQTTSMFPTTDDQLQLGMSQPDTGGLDADVFEVLIYTRDLTSGEIATLWEYYKGKYSIDFSQPKRVRNVFAWFEADEIGASEGDLVSGWNSLSSSLQLQQGDSSEQPTYTENNLRSVPSVRFEKGQSLASTTQVSLDNVPFSALVLYQPDQDVSHSILKLDNQALELKKLKVQGDLDQLKVFSNNSESTVTSEQVATVTDEFRSNLVSLRDEAEGSSLFYIEGEKVSNQEATSTENILPDVQETLILGEDLQADLSSLVLLKGRVRDAEVELFRDYWFEKYPSTNRSQTTLKATATLFIKKIEETATASLSATSEALVGGVSNFQSNATVNAAGGLEKELDVDWFSDADLQAEAIGGPVFPFEADASLSGSVSVENHIESDLKGFSYIVATNEALRSLEASIKPEATITPTVTSTREFTASLVANADLTEVSGDEVSGSASLDSNATINTAESATKEANTSLSATSTFAAEGQPTQTASASLNSTSAISANEAFEGAGQSSITSSSNVVAVAEKTVEAQASTTSSSNVVAAAEKTAEAQAPISSDASINAVGEVDGASGDTLSALASINSSADLQATEDSTAGAESTSESVGL